MSKHTPGPWVDGGYDVEASDRTLVCSMSGWRGPQATKANARLIAAAPELLEALKLADAALSGANMNMNVVQRKVSEAIAKAEGAQ